METEQIIEEDETGRVCFRYTANLAIIPEATSSTQVSRSILQTLSDVFMPAGFPGSVSSDYFEYQLYDSLQAFSSSIAGLLASRAVLEGVGVGDGNASATQALLLTIAQDAVGRLATILFAWRIGTALEPEAKRYRLLADIFNDAAMLLDCLSPALPARIRVLALCTSGAGRALCGVAAGGAKAALSVHFARANNIGDLNAKDASQETVIGLLGMLAGSFIVSRVTSHAATWSLLLVLLTIHISTNYWAVRAVVMHTLNRQRATLVYELFRKHKTVPSPRQASQTERIFASGATLRAQARCEIGIPLGRLVPGAPLRIFSGEQYILWFMRPPSWNWAAHTSFGICLKKGAHASDQLRAWAHAIELAHLVFEVQEPHARPELLSESLRKVDAIFPDFLKAMKRVGWDVDHPALMTRPSFRVLRLTGEAALKKPD